MRLGFDKRSGIDLPGEIIPICPYGERLLQQALRRARLELGVTLNLAIGQGENDQTVVNMARFYTALATDGLAARPEIARNDDDRSRTRVIQLDAAQTAGSAERDEERRVGARDGGERRASRTSSLAGKTGTAQNAHDATRDHAWFVGFAPADDPKIVVAVMLEFGEHGYYAARIASKIIERYLKGRHRRSRPAPRGARDAGASGFRAMMHRRVITADLPLIGAALALSLFGIAMVYSAGQTDVPDRRRHERGCRRSSG